jgi:hypothetical protein
MIFLAALRQASPWRAMGVTAALAGAGTAGRLFDKVVFYRNMGAIDELLTISAKTSLKAAKANLDWIVLQSLFHPVLALAWCLSMAFCLWVAINATRRSIQHKPIHRAHVFFAVYLASLAPANLCAMVINGQSLPRYAIPAYIIPIFFAWPMLLRGGRGLLWRIERWRVAHAVAGLQAAAMAALLCLAPSRNYTALAKLGDYYPDEVRRLDAYAEKNHLRYGISDYWLAKRVTMLSKAGLVVVQVNAGLYPLLWINSKGWYSHPFQFALLKDLNKEFIISRFGPPSGELDDVKGEAVACVYGTPEFRDQFKGNQVNANFEKPRSDFEFWTVATAGDVGRNQGLAREATDAQPRQGVLMNGPNLWLPKGDYRFAFRAAGKGGKGGSAVGKWVVYAARHGKNDVLREGWIFGGDAPAREGFFSLDRLTAVGFEVDYAGAGTLRSDGLYLKRMR